jgi:hypothetical protein
LSLCQYWAKLPYCIIGGYQYLYFRLQICFNVSFLLVNERFLQVLPGFDAHFCAKKTAKGVDSHRFTFTPGSTIGIDETVKNEGNKHNAMLSIGQHN